MGENGAVERESAMLHAEFNSSLMAKVSNFTHGRKDKKLSCALESQDVIIAKNVTRDKN